MTSSGDISWGGRHPTPVTPLPSRSRLGWLFFALAIGLVVVFGLSVSRLGQALGERVRRTIIERDASVLHSVARREIAERQAESGGGESDGARVDPVGLLHVVLGTARQEGMLSVAVFDADGAVIDTAPGNLLATDLPFSDYTELLKGDPISRFHPALALDQYFTTAARDARGPVLEILLPLAIEDRFLGFAQYYMDARPLARELSNTTARVRLQTAATFAIGSALIIAVVAAGYLALRRAEQRLRESHAHLQRANLELTLAAKTSAVGQVASHLLHSLQGSVAGLRQAMATRGSDAPDWVAAAAYTSRMQEMIAETLGLLSDEAHATSYLISGDELLELIRRRHEPAARARRVSLMIEGRLAEPIDSHRGSLLCLIASNLTENALAASPPGRTVTVQLQEDERAVKLSVADAGSGVDPELAAQLFQPGRSGRPGGTGLGLAISRLLARRLGGDVHLVRTGPDGSVFAVSIPRQPAGDS